MELEKRVERRRLTKKEIRHILDVGRFLDDIYGEDRLPGGESLVKLRFDSDRNRIGIVYQRPDNNKIMRGENGKRFIRWRNLRPEPGQPKYTSARNSGVRLFFPRGVLDLLQGPEATLHVTEGEKKAAAAVARGIACIGIGGIWSWGKDKQLHKDFKLIPNIQARHIVMVYDSDARDASGEVKRDFELADQAFKNACHRRGIAKVSRCILPSDGGQKVGLDDFLLKQSPSVFRDLVEMQSEYFNLSKWILTGPALGRETFRPIRMIIDPWLANEGLTLLYGEPGVGKSLFTMAMAEAVTRKNPSTFLDWKVRGQCGVLLVDGEMSAPTIQERARHMGLLNRENFYVLLCTEISRRKGQSISLTNAQHRAMLHKAIMEYPAQIVIIDNLVSLAMTEDENSASNWAVIREWLVGLRASGKHIILVHHSGKSGTQRGTSHRADNVDTVMCLRKKTKTDKTVRVIFEKARNFAPQHTVRNYHMDVTNNGISFELVNVEADEGTGSKREAIEQALKEGKLKQKEIAERYDVSRGYVSRINTALKAKEETSSKPSGKRGGLLASKSE